MSEFLFRLALLVSIAIGVGLCVGAGVLLIQFLRLIGVL